MNKQSCCAFVASFVLAGVAQLHASVEGQNELTIDFTDAKDVAEKAAWSPADTVGVAAGGLGWEGEAAASRDGWIQTKAMAVGLSWRPASSVHLRVEITPTPKPITLGNGQKTTPWVGEAFARYSPDG